MNNIQWLLGRLLSSGLVALLSVACGGEAFTGTELDAVGGEAVAGEAGAPNAAGGPAAGSAGASRGGSASAGGSGSSAAGKPSGGASQGGTGGAPPVTCELDLEKLTAALPKSFVWEDYTYTDGQACVTCRDSPCATIKMISWGVPQVMEDGRLQYLPNADMTMVSMNNGTNDGACTKQDSCAVKPGNPQLFLTVTSGKGGWVVAKAEMLSTLLGYQCDVLGPVSADFDKDADVALQGLEIPCN